MKTYLRTGLKLLAALAVLFVSYWFMLPPINVVSPDFWKFVLFAVVVLLVALVPSPLKQLKVLGETARRPRDGKSIYVDEIKKNVKGMGILLKIGGGAIAAILLFLAVGSVAGWELFNASSYRDLLVMDDGDFATDVAELNMSQIPVVDRDTAERLGSRKLGEMSDLVSQFDIASDYTQINYHGSPYRVTPLAYADIIKWINNMDAGLPGYITVDMVTQETTLVRFEGEGMKYSYSDLFMRDIVRHLRFHYPTAIFDEISFEIDEEGTPYWVASVVDYKVALWSGADISGVVLCNAMNGDCTYYSIDQVPQWVDQAYSSDMILQQLIWNGEYVSGFWNSIFGQRDVLQPTDGYNYIAVDDDVWIYTGMTSVLADESNVGFVLVNLRTKESKFYSVPGAEEYSAMSSAEGQVQHLGYSATFPILLNIADRPTYFMALKDGAGLSKMYAFVDVEQYQVVATGYTVSEARENYAAKLKADENIDAPVADTESKEGTLEALSTAVVEGNTKYYLRLTGDATVYVADISVSEQLPFAKVGDQVTLTVDGSNHVLTFVPGTAVAW